MASFKEAIQTAWSRKVVPPFQAGSVHDLGTKLGLNAPISIRDEMLALNGLPPASVSFDSGTIVAGYTHAETHLFAQSDGAVAFSGSVHESGVVGEHFTIAMALLDVVDADGKVLAFVHSDTIVGQLTFGFSDKNWLDIGGNEVIRDRWEAVRGSRVRTVLHVSTDPWQVTEFSLLALFVAAGAIFGGLGIASTTKQCSENGTWTCGWRPVGSPGGGALTPGGPNDSPGAGFEYYCRCEY